jgi:hypothetical protein
VAGFIRRFTSLPTLAVIRQIESIVIVDLAPPDPTTGAGSGTVLLVGEFEDGFFAVEEEAKGGVEVFGSEDFRTKFGDFGYTYGGVIASNPCSRRHLGEFWNGNGYLKAFKLKAQRLLVGRVDSSVGEVSFDVLAAINGGVGTFALAIGQTLSVTTNTGSGATAALTAARALKAGAAATFGTIAAGDTFAIRVDGGPSLPVTFAASDTTQGTVIARVNSTLGMTVAVANTTQVDFRGLVFGTGGRIELIEVTAGVLAKLGHTAGVVNGTSNIAANIDAVTVTEVVTFVNGTAAITTVNGAAGVNPNGTLRIFNSVSAPASTISVAAGAMATALQLSPIATTVAITGHLGGTIPAGTRLRASGTPGPEWVAMQTLDIPAGALGPFLVKVRPGLDDGTAATQAANTVNTVVDQPGFAPLTVNNASALSAALTEVQLDARYKSAFDAALNESGDVRTANYLLCARRSDTVVREGLANAIQATACGLFARKFITGDPLGTTVAQSFVNAAALRGGSANVNAERVFYTTKGLKVRVPQIAERGTAGGLGFTADGVITVRPDGPLTTINATLPPEENPGQQTGLINDFFAVDTFGETVTIDTYIAWRANGLCVPRIDRVSGTVFQSGVTLALASGRTTQARRKIADFVQDTAAELFAPFSKQLNKQARRDKIRGLWDSFLASLQSAENPEQARIEGFRVDDTANAGNTPQVLAQGVYFLQTTVRSLSSLDNIVVQTEIGPNAIITREAA